MVGTQLRSYSPPSSKRPRESSATLVAAWEVAADRMSKSRPASDAFMPSTSTCTPNTPTTGPPLLPPPSLSEILSNISPPPWTLSAFTAYLSQNHCLETLEFTMEAQRYAADYAHFVLTGTRTGEARTRANEEYICSLWAKLMQAYIVPCAPREVNLPSRVRDALLNLPCSPPPPRPTELDEAVGIVYELMNDSVLVPFIESVTTSTATHHHWEADTVMRGGETQGGERASRSRSRMRSSRDRSSKQQQQLHGRPRESSRSPKFLPAVLGGRGSTASSRSVSASTSAEMVDKAGLSDDSGSSNSPPGMEPMTPPTTPPTTEWVFTTSPPGGFQRAINAHNQGWKKVGAKLGFKKTTTTKGTHKRQPTSSVFGSTPTDEDLVMSDSSLGSPL